MNAQSDKIHKKETVQYYMITLDRVQVPDIGNIQKLAAQISGILCD